VEPQFVDVVGHISLQSLEKADKKRHQRQDNRPQKMMLQKDNTGQGPVQPPQKRGPQQQQRGQHPQPQKQRPERGQQPQKRPPNPNNNRPQNNQRRPPGNEQPKTD
jgi:hypothetical protein